MLRRFELRAFEVTSLRGIICPVLDVLACCENKNLESLTVYPISLNSAKALGILCEKYCLKDLNVTIVIRSAQPEVTHTRQAITYALQHSRGLRSLYMWFPRNVRVSSPTINSFIRSILPNELRTLHLKKSDISLPALEKSDQVADLIQVLSGVAVENVSLTNHDLLINSSILLNSACNLIKNRTVQEIYEFGLHPDYFEPFIESLELNTTLRSIYLDIRLLGPNENKRLSEIFARNRAITHLSLEFDYFTELKDLILTMAKNTRLENLILYDHCCLLTADFCLKCLSQSQNIIELIIALGISGSHLTDLDVSYRINREFMFVLL